jgi:hypothetical protein
MSASPSPNQVNPKPSILSRSATQVGSKPGKPGAINSRTLRYTLLLGAITGFAFSSALWAYETVLFIQAHVAYPWIPFLAGTILCVIVCTLAALLTCLVNRALMGIIFWVLAARLMAELVIYIPLKIAPRLMIFFEPGLQSRLPGYPINASIRTWGEIGTVGLAIFLGILGLIQLTLVDQAVPATSSAGRLMPYFVFVLVIFLASGMLSDMINQQLRAPLVATNYLIQFAIDHQNTSVDPVIARQMHLSTVDPISDLINRPRRLFLGQYDETFLQVDVLIDFGGEWVDCTTVSNQLVFCKSITNP